jgi:hypothetical protein
VFLYHLHSPSLPVIFNPLGLRRADAGLYIAFLFLRMCTPTVQFVAAVVDADTSKMNTLFVRGGTEAVKDSIHDV